MRTRLRPKYSNEELGKIYATPHVHKGWADHRQRVRSTIALAKWFEDVRSVADLSAGDATIIDALDIHAKYIGDFAARYEFKGAIEKTIDEIPNVDLFILSETLEHLDDPDLVLRKIRAKTKYLVLSTPEGEDNAGNPEHYWGWNTEDVGQMLTEAGFEPEVYTLLSFPNPSLVYDYQIWGCS